jgi:hypothetical protein
MFNVYEVTAQTGATKFETFDVLATSEKDAWRRWIATHTSGMVVSVRAK